MDETDLEKAIVEGDIKALCEGFFKFNPTPKQIDIIRIIADGRRNVAISCMTRYGKTRCVAIGVILYLLYHKNKKVILIGPTGDQAKILRNYIIEHLAGSPVLRSVLEIDAKGFDRLKKEISQKRMTMKNGCSLLVLSAEGTGERLMGHGGDYIIRDEDCLIKTDVYENRIARMTGDDAVNARTVVIFNPWHANGQTHNHWNDPDFVKIHIDWRVAVEEGRTTVDFIEKKRSELPPISFRVLYDAEFPDESEDAVFTRKSIEDAEQREVPDWAKDQFTHRLRIASVDIAREGRDFTVMNFGVRYDSQEMGIFYEQEEVLRFSKPDTMDSAAILMKNCKEKNIDEIHIDSVGLGSTFFDVIRKFVRDEGLKIRVIPCHFGQGVEDKKFRNKKAYNYFRLRQILTEGRIKLKPISQQKIELLKIKQKISLGSERWETVDPDDKSPDYADSLVYLCWLVPRMNFRATTL